MAIKICKSIEWENFLLNEENRLCLYLHEKYRNEYRKWNEIVLTNKEIIKEHKWFKVYDLEHGFSNNMLSILTGAVVENSYHKMIKHIPIFFKELLNIFENGYIPCGWEGEIEEEVEYQKKFNFSSGVLLIFPCNLLSNSTILGA